MTGIDKPPIADWAIDFDHTRSDEWMKRIPDFELSDPGRVRWSTGQVRGPRTLPVRLLRTAEVA